MRKLRSTQGLKRQKPSSVYLTHLAPLSLSPLFPDRIATVTSIPICRLVQPVNVIWTKSRLIGSAESLHTLRGWRAPIERTRHPKRTTMHHSKVPAAGHPIDRFQQKQLIFRYSDWAEARVPYFSPNWTAPTDWYSLWAFCYKQQGRSDTRDSLPVPSEVPAICGDFPCWVKSSHRLHSWWWPSVKFENKIRAVSPVRIAPVDIWVSPDINMAKHSSILTSQFSALILSSTPYICKSANYRNNFSLNLGWGHLEAKRSTLAKNGFRQK